MKRHGRTRVLAPFLAATLLGWLAPVIADAELARGKQVFTLDDWGGPALQVWTYIPEYASLHEPVVFVLHGTNRNAEDYIDQWIPYARQYALLLVVPEFAEKTFPSDEGYNFGNTITAAGEAQPRQVWAFNAIEPAFDRFRTLSGATADSYSLYGHSAGAQFAHRFLYFVPHARVDQVISANAGWYTLPTPELKFPYGLDGAPVDREALRQALAQPMVILLGTADTDYLHRDLRRTPEAMRQGENRFERGRTFYRVARRRAAEWGVPFNWRLEYAFGVGHSNRRMAPHAARLIAEAAGYEVASALFLGDTSPGESYQEEYERNGKGNILEEKGYIYSFAAFADMMREADHVVMNLETPITQRRDHPLQGKDYLHWTSVEHTPPLLNRLSVDAVSLANNHAMDFRAPGLEETLKILDEYQIEAFGAGMDIGAAAKPHVFTLRAGDDALTVGVIGLFEHRRDHDEVYRSYAGKDTPGVLGFDPERIRREIEALKARYNDPLIVAFPHWGENYAWRSQEQRRMAELLVAAGVDLIIGHGGHRLQEIERVNGALVVYGIGNFVFNSNGRFAREAALPYSLIAELVLVGGPGDPRTFLRLYPILSDNRITAFQPRFLEEEELTGLVGVMDRHSPLGGVSWKDRAWRDAEGCYFEVKP